MGFSFLTQELAIDLGTANTVIFQNDQIVLDEPSIVAIDNTSGKAIALGHKAKLMQEKENPGIKTIRPMRDGVIADFNAAELMIRGFIKQVNSKRRSLFTPNIKMVVGIIDNKAYKNGYSISGDHKRVMEDVYIPNVAKYGKSKYPAAFFTYIAGSFGKNIDNQVREIYRDTNVCGSAMPVDIFINLAQDYAEKGYDHTDLKFIFSVNREIRLTDILGEQNDEFSFTPVEFDLSMVAMPKE